MNFKPQVAYCQCILYKIGKQTWRYLAANAAISISHVINDSALTNGPVLPVTVSLLSDHGWTFNTV